MVALITPSSLPAPVRGARSAESTPPTLRLIRGGLDAPARDHSLLVGLVAVAVMLAGVVGLRLVQGQPPADAAGVAPSPSAASSAAAVAESGEALRVIAQGDTLWAIAEELAPGRDPRPVVDALADRNGGSALRAGDVLVIPAELLGSTALVTTSLATNALITEPLADLAADVRD